MIEDRIQLNENLIYQKFREEGKTDIEITEHLINLYKKMVKFSIRDGELAYEDMDEMDIHNISRIQELTSKKERFEAQKTLKEKVDEISNYEHDFVEESLVSKMIFLNELGILEYLRKIPKKGVSDNAIAFVLSKIIGEKQRSIQPLLKPILFNSDDRKNPYKNVENVESIREILSRKGFNKN